MQHQGAVRGPSLAKPQSPLLSSTRQKLRRGIIPSACSCQEPGREGCRGANDPPTKGHTERTRRRGWRKITQSLHRYLESLQEPSWLYQLLPKPPLTGRRLLTDPRFSCNISSGSFPKFLLHDFSWFFLIWEKRMPPLQRVRGKGSLFSNSLAPGLAAAAAALPLAGCLPTEQPGSPAPEAGLKWGFGAAGPGSTRRGEGRKVQHPVGGVPCPSAEGKPKLLSCLQL